jgi:hypothetical protein
VDLRNTMMKVSEIRKRGKAYLYSRAKHALLILVEDNRLHISPFTNLSPELCKETVNYIISETSAYNMKDFLHFPQHYAETVNIGFVVIRLVFYHFWRHPQWTGTEKRKL